MIRNSTNEISIKPRASTASKIILAAVALLALVLLVYFSYDFGKRSGGNQSSQDAVLIKQLNSCLLYTSPSPRDLSTSRMPSSA